MVVFLGSGTIVADFRHGGMKDWDSDSLKILVKTPASWSAHSLRTLLVTPSGPAAFPGFTALSVHLTSCSCTVRLELLQFSGRAVAALCPFTSKRAKKWFSSSASLASPSVVAVLLDLKWVRCWSPCHTWCVLFSVK